METNEKSKVDEAAEWAREKMHASAEKLAEIAEREEVREAKAKFLNEWNNIKTWCCANWQAGRYGKFRVVVIVAVIALALKGLLGGWGESDAMKAQREIAEMQKEAAEMEAGAALMGALLGGGETRSTSSRSNGPQTKTWICAQCGNQVPAKYHPPTTKCRAYRGQRDGSCARNCRWKQVH